MFFILTSGDLLVNETNLQALYTLVEPTVTGLVQDPLAVLHLNNRLYIYRKKNEY